jgi:hypothetical protein
MALTSRHATASLAASIAGTAASSSLSADAFVACAALATSFVASA